MAATNGTVWGNKVAADWSGNFSNSTSVTYDPTNGTSGILTGTAAGSKTGDFEYISYLDCAADRDTLGIAFCVNTTAPTLTGYYNISFRSAYNSVQFYFRRDSLAYGSGGTAISAQAFAHAKGASTTTMWFRVVRTGDAWDFYADVITARGSTPTWTKLTTLSVASEATYAAGHYGYSAPATLDSTNINISWFQSFTQASSSVVPQTMYTYRTRTS